MTDKTHRYSLLHDAELIALMHEKKEKKASITVAHVDGSEATLELHGVKAIRMVDFISQNVISRVLCSEAMSFDERDLQRLVAWTNSLSDGTCLISQEAIEKYVTDIQSGSLKLLAIEPSWGAELVCIYAAD
ncbi:hypothetical protein [Cupriavidus oxalaticus]|uniref:hypothetical protein n=1 Tax=Cupriavidus oxalaticus TaxID=96344 RepID=UPI00317229DD